MELKSFFKKVLVFLISLCILYVLQTALFPFLELAGIVPNLLLILTVFYGFMRNTREGMLAGFFCGIILDLSTGLLFSVHALSLLLIGTLNGLLRLIFYSDDVKLPIVFTVLSDIIYGLFMFTFFFLPRGSNNFKYYFFHLMLPEAVYSMLMAFFLYFIFYRIFNWLNHEERKVEHIL